MKNYYEILEISEGASADDIKTKYRKLMMKYHPDRHMDNPLVNLAEREVVKYQEAYEVLGDLEKRRWHDIELKEIRVEKMSPLEKNQDPAPLKPDQEADYTYEAEETYETDYDPEEEYEEDEDNQPSELSIFIVKFIFKILFIGMVGFLVTKSMKGFIYAVILFYAIKAARYFKILDRIFNLINDIRYWRYTLRRRK